MHKAPPRPPRGSCCCQHSHPSRRPQLLETASPIRSWRKATPEVTAKAVKSKHSKSSMGRTGIWLATAELSQADNHKPQAGTIARSRHDKGNALTDTRAVRSALPARSSQAPKPTRNTDTDTPTPGPLYKFRMCKIYRIRVHWSLRQCRHFFLRKLDPKKRKPTSHHTNVGCVSLWPYSYNFGE